MWLSRASFLSESEYRDGLARMTQSSVSNTSDKEVNREEKA